MIIDLEKCLLQDDEHDLLEEKNSCIDPFPGEM